MLLPQQKKPKFVKKYWPLYSYSLSFFPTNIGATGLIEEKQTDILTIKILALF